MDMTFTLDHWTEEDYVELLSLFFEWKEDKLCAFTRRLVPEATGILGIRIPLLRMVAKQIVKGNYEEFLTLAKSRYHEEILLQGLVIGNCAAPFDRLLELVQDYLPLISNWASCDTFATSLKQFGKHRAEGIALVRQCVASDNPWETRFGLILLLSHYLCDAYIDEVLAVSRQIHSDHYYVKMGNAWLLSVAFVKYPDKTLPLLSDGQLDPWTNQKTLQKILESNRVDVPTKERIRQLKEAIQ